MDSLKPESFCDVGYEVLHVGNNAARRKRSTVGEFVDGEFGDVYAVEIHLANGSVVKHAIGGASYYPWRWCAAWWPCR